MSIASKSVLQNLISQNKTQQAIDSLLAITQSLDDKELHNEVLLQSSKLKQYKKQGRKGIISFENQGISDSRINDALLQIIDELPDHALNRKATEPKKSKNPMLWQYVLGMGTVLGIFAAIAEFSGYNLKDIFDRNTHKTEQHPNPSHAQNSIFLPDDQAYFNVLIIRFEDYITGEDTYCIGRAVQEHLNVIGANEDFYLPLKIVYVSDSIQPPESQDEAIRIQKKHHSDLIIYGLARQVEQNCAGAEICFRYKISEHVIANVASNKDIKAAKHDGEYIQTSPMAIEAGKLQIDSVSMKYWISSLINIKAKKINKAFSDLADLSDKDNDLLSDEEKSMRYFTSGNTYSDLKEYEKAIDYYDKAILLNQEYKLAYKNRGMLIII